MVQFQVKKIVAVCLLEAAKVTLDQLGQFRMELSNKGREAPKELGSLYGDCRRLRDFLQRCVGAFPEAVDLELETRDQALLVACCRRAVETIDDRLGGDASPQEREWLQKKRQVLWDQAIDLAEKPLVELPLPRLGPASATNVKALNARINNKVNGPGRLAPPTGFYTGMPPQPNATVPPPDSAQVPGLLTSGGQPQQTWEQHQHQQQLQQQQPSPPARPQSAPQPASPAAPNDLAAGTSGSDAEFVHRDGDEVFDSRPSELLDVRQIRDPRLRALMVFDLRAYERAIDAKDHRLAAVHLASILEGVVLDHAIPRRTELGLHGAPDTWDAQEILLQLLGDACSPRDRSFVYHVFTARNLIRPAMQLVSPSVVTPASLEQMTEFIRRALREMGLHHRVDAAQAHAPAPQGQPAPRKGAQRPKAIAGDRGAPPDGSGPQTNEPV